MERDDPRVIALAEVIRTMRPDADPYDYARAHAYAHAYAHAHAYACAYALTDEEKAQIYAAYALLFT